MPFELRDHTADVAVEATGETLEAVFAATADGLAAASVDIVPDDGERFGVSVTAEGREALLFDYLDELIYLRDVRSELPVDNEVATIERDDAAGGPAEREGPDPDSGSTEREGTDGEPAWRLEGSARGVPHEAIDAREVKAVTYSEMALRETDEGWSAYVVFDV